MASTAAKASATRSTLLAFKPAAHDKTCRVTLSVRVPRLPSGGSIRWSVPAAHRGSITLSGNPAVVSHVHTGARVEIIGRPNIVQETVFSDADTGDGNGGGCLATGMRVFNAIPAVCAAPPGILSALDLPLIAGRGVIRADGFRSRS